jgi:hypothetical protein
VQLWNTIARKLARPQIAEAKDRAYRAAVEAIRDGDPGWRQVGGGIEHIFETSTWADRRTILEIGYRMLRKSPLAKGVVETLTSFAAGDEVTWEANDERVQRSLQTHWESPLNRWDRRLHLRMIDASYTGELLLPVFVNPINGFVIVRNMFAGRIVGVEVNEDDAEQADIVRVSDPNDFTKTIPLKVIQANTDSDEENMGMMEGECFLFRSNPVSHDPRGYSDLLVLMDWISDLDATIKTSNERSLLALKHVIDLKVNGGDEATLNKYKAEYQDARPGSVVAHNEEVEAKVISADLGSAEQAVDYRTKLRHMLPGIGLPEHALGMGGDTTRTTAESMTPIMHRTMQTRRKRVKWLLEDVGEFVVHQAVIHGVIPETADLSFEVVLPKVKEEDMAEAARELVALANTAAVASENGLITPERAVELVAKALEKFDIKYDPAKEYADIQGAAPEPPSEPSIEEALSAMAG